MCQGNGATARTPSRRDAGLIPIPIREIPPQSDKAIRRNDHLPAVAVGAAFGIDPGQIYIIEGIQLHRAAIKLSPLGRNGSPRDAGFRLDRYGAPDRSRGVDIPHGHLSGEGPGHNHQLFQPVGIGDKVDRIERGQVRLREEIPLSGDSDGATGAGAGTHIEVAQGDRPVRTRDRDFPSANGSAGIEIPRGDAAGGIEHQLAAGARRCCRPQGGGCDHTIVELGIELGIELSIEWGVGIGGVGSRWILKRIARRIQRGIQDLASDRPAQGPQCHRPSIQTGIHQGRGCGQIFHPRGIDQTGDLHIAARQGNRAALGGDRTAHGQITGAGQLKIPAPGHNILVHGIIPGHRCGQISPAQLQDLGEDPRGHRRCCPQNDFRAVGVQIHRFPVHGARCFDAQGPIGRSGGIRWLSLWIQNPQARNRSQRGGSKSHLRGRRQADRPAQALLGTGIELQRFHAPRLRSRPNAAASAGPQRRGIQLCQHNVIDRRGVEVSRIPVCGSREPKIQDNAAAAAGEGHIPAASGS